MSTRPSAARAAERASPARTFAEDVRDGLRRRPRQIAPRWFYDDLGSALFEAICELPWYAITRAELRLLRRAAAPIARHLAAADALVELGPGSGGKLALIVEAFLAGRPGLDVHLIDVSPHALELAARTLSAFPGVDVHAHRATFDEGVDGLRGRAGSRLIAFLGSNIGNFDPDEARRFVGAAAEAAGPRGALLLGVDLVKPVRDLLLAYDDPIGVTAAFNRNLLARMNRELGADFDLSAFRHEARWNAQASRVEMHLISTRVQEVEIAGAGLRVPFQSGESIWTESSYKYDLAGLQALGESAGLRIVDQWVDEEARFALTLFGRT